MTLVKESASVRGQFDSPDLPFPPTIYRHRAPKSESPKLLWRLPGNSGCWGVPGELLRRLPLTSIEMALRKGSLRSTSPGTPTSTPSFPGSLHSSPPQQFWGIRAWGPCRWSGEWQLLTYHLSRQKLRYRDHSNPCKIKVPKNNSKTISVMWSLRYRAQTNCPRQNYYGINSEKGKSRKFWDCFTGIHTFQTDSSSLSCKKNKAWKLLETIINFRQGLPRNKISNSSEVSSWNNFPDPL